MKFRNKIFWAVMFVVPSVIMSSPAMYSRHKEGDSSVDTFPVKSTPRNDPADSSISFPSLSTISPSDGFISQPPPLTEVPNLTPIFDGGQDDSSTDGVAESSDHLVNKRSLDEVFLEGNLDDETADYPVEVKNAISVDQDAQREINDIMAEIVDFVDKERKLKKKLEDKEKKDKVRKLEEEEARKSWEATCNYTKRIMRNRGVRQDTDPCNLQLPTKKVGKDHSGTWKDQISQIRGAIIYRQGRLKELFELKQHIVVNIRCGCFHQRPPATKGSKRRKQNLPLAPNLYQE